MLGERGSEAVGADPAGLREAGDFLQGGEKIGGVPSERIEVLVIDFGRHALVPDGQEVHPLRLSDHHGGRAEGRAARPPELAGPRGVAHVRGAAEHERVHPLGCQGVEEPSAPFPAKPREVDAGRVLEGHGPDVCLPAPADGCHRVISKGS